MPEQPHKTDHLRQYLMLGILLLLALLIAFRLKFMLSAVLGAVAFYILLRKPHMFLRRRFGIGKNLSSAVLLSGSLLLMLLPLYFSITFIVQKIEPLVHNPDPLINALNSISAFINRYTEFSLLSPTLVGKISGMLQTWLPAILDSGFSMATNLVMMYFLLWFMLGSGLEMERWLKRNSPFNRHNTQRIALCIREGVVSNAAGIILLGLLQGLVAMAGYLFFGIREPVLWGMITGMCSVIPFAGTMLAWVPLSIWLMAGGHLYNGIGLFAYGLLIVGSSDNIFRFLLQKKLASTHPLVTVLGVIAGLGMLGFWGLIFGPLMISLLMLFYRIYREEMVTGKIRPS